MSFLFSACCVSIKNKTKVVLFTTIVLNNFGSRKTSFKKYDLREFFLENLAATYKRLPIPDLKYKLKYNRRKIN